jgi:putative transposase
MLSPQGARNRRSLHLPEYNYARPGAYSLTLCVHNRLCLFGDAVSGEIRLNRFGKIAREEWMRSPDLRPELVLDLVVVMPNHLHGIVFINPNEGSCVAVCEGTDVGVGAHGRVLLQDSTLLPQRPKRSLGSSVAGFKSVATKRVNEIRCTRGRPLWQRN